MTNYQTIILGSSPDALTAATYLARAGQRVLLLEPSQHIGGVVSTRQFADGFHGDVGLTGGRLDAQIVADLKLQQHGLEVIQRDTISSLLPDGRSFTLPHNREAATAAIAKFAPNDAAKYAKFMDLLDLATDLLRSAYGQTPPKFFQPDADDVSQLQALAGKLQGYGKRQMTEVTRLLVMSARDFLDEWFENQELKGLLAGLCVRTLTQGPFAAGTTFNMLHHLALGDGYFRATAKGGLGAITKALAAAAKSAGVEIRTNAGNCKVVINDGVAVGVTCNGETIDTENVVSDFGAIYTFRQLVAPAELEPEFNRLLQNVRYNGSVARINFALKALPQIPNLHTDALKGTLVVAPSITYLEKAYDAVKRGNLSDKPYLEITIPTLTDPALAPTGKHVMSVWVQYVPYGSKVTEAQVKDAVLARLAEVIPNFQTLVESSQVTTPQAFEAQYNLTEGHLYSGDLTLYQALFMRPVPGCTQYKTPIEKLFLCGAATHPGGGVSGLSGRHVASKIGVKELALSSK